MTPAEEEAGHGKPFEQMSPETMHQIRPPGLAGNHSRSARIPVAVWYRYFAPTTMISTL